MSTVVPDSVELRIGIALVVGLVIGAEREQRMREAPRPAAGIRTFAITALLGAVARALDEPLVLAVLGAGVALATIVAYFVGDRSDPGLTSEIALVLTFALGALALDRPFAALAVGITTALLLALRTPIHTAVRDVLSPAELRDALVVAAAAIVVLPLLPDRAVDPWGVLNAFTLWRLVVLILAIHLAAHIAQRALGPRWGPPIAGLASGFVSSTATIAAMGTKAEQGDEAVEGALAAATASNVGSFVQLAILVATASPSLMGTTMAVPLASSGLAALAFAARYAIRSARSAKDVAPPGRAVDLRGALVFALLVTVVSIGAALIGRHTGSPGVLVAATLAAFANAHASSASVASLHAAGSLGEGAAVVAVLACVSTNSITKIVLALRSGPREYAVPVVLGILVAVAAGWAGFAAVSMLAPSAAG